MQVPVIMYFPNHVYWCPCPRPHCRSLYRYHSPSSYSSEPAMPCSECSSPPCAASRVLKISPCLRNKRLIPGVAGPSGRRFESGRRRSSTSGLRSYAGPLGESGISCSIGRSTVDEQPSTAASSEVVPGLNNSDMSETGATSQHVQIRYRFRIFGFEHSAQIVVGSTSSELDLQLHLPSTNCIWSNDSE